jgi:hypothetical protein
MYSLKSKTNELTYLKEEIINQNKNIRNANKKKYLTNNKKAK